jgi:hypothetical protein
VEIYMCHEMSSLLCGDWWSTSGRLTQAVHGGPC